MASIKSKIEDLTKRIYVFTYIMIEPDNYSIVYENGVPIRLSVMELYAIAKEWRRGHICGQDGFELLPKSVQDKIEGGFTQEMVDEIEEEGWDFGELSIVWTTMPVELELAMREICGKNKSEEYDFDPFNYEFEDLLDVNIHYTHSRDGQEIEEVCHYGLRLDIANIMLEVLWENVEEDKQFEYMKKVSPKAYECVYNDIHTWCNNLHLAEYGECVDIQLKAFPVEVFESLSK